MSTDIPLSLYVHIPWCVKKCPYCDFNSHEKDSAFDEYGYVDALLRDLDREFATCGSRPLQSIFFGGGTPSLFSAGAISTVIDHARTLFGFDDIEITMEANPGTFEQEKFTANRSADAIQVEIEAQPGLKFIPNEIRVPPGRPIALTVKNKDVNMHHNLVLLQPGHLQKIGEAATLLANDPSALGIHYVPEEPESIWRFTPILQPNEEYTIDFVTPQKTGAYPFVCTFPGHWQVMRGVLYVVNKNDPLPPLEDQIEHTRKFVKMWMTKDLDFEMKNLHQGSIDRGRKIFNLAGCVKCHTVNGEGSKVGPDLTDVHKKFTGMQLLEQIISPSKEINKDFKVKIINRSNGRIHTGLVHKWDVANKVLLLLENPLQPDNLTVIPFSQISSITNSKLSTMPKGLLMTFNRDEIRDLVLYVQSGGKTLPKRGP